MTAPGEPRSPAARRVLRRPEDLIDAGLAGRDRAGDLARIGLRYAIGITGTMAERIDREAADDPLARQFVPDAAELITTPEELADPIGDDAHEAVRGLVHRYPDRVLLKLVTACAVYCRFCFRREMVGKPEGQITRTDLDRAVAYIRDHSEIWEVILSGGDPMVAAPAKLAELTASLAAIDHVGTLRLHTRVPVVAPELVTDALIEALTATRLVPFVAIHANHARELGPEAYAAIRRLAEAGISLVSQTVLLRGVNDNPDTLAELMRALVAAGIKPYYLHHPDPAPGTGHFRLSIEEGLALVEAFRHRVSGLCQPTYVLDIPGGFGKARLGPTDLSTTSGGLAVRDRSGRWHTELPGSR